MAYSLDVIESVLTATGANKRKLTWVLVYRWEWWIRAGVLVLSVAIIQLAKNFYRRKDKGSSCRSPSLPPILYPAHAFRRYSLFGRLRVSLVCNKFSIQSCRQLRLDQADYYSVAPALPGFNMVNHSVPGSQIGPELQYDRLWYTSVWSVDEQTERVTW